MNMTGMEMKLEQLLAYGSRTAIIQNLKDAGCSQETINCCLSCLDMGKKSRIIKAAGKSQERSFKEST